MPYAGAIGDGLGRVATAAGAPDRVSTGLSYGGFATALTYEAYVLSGYQAAGVTFTEWAAIGGTVAAPYAAGAGAIGGVFVAGYGGYGVVTHSPSRGYVPDGGYSTGYGAKFYDLYSGLWSWW